MPTEASNRAPGRGGDVDGTAREVPPGEPVATSPQRRGWVLALVLLASAAPLVAAVVAVARQGWTPVGEFAQAELRVRDFWAHPPSLGAVGRLRTPTDVTSHPGPSAWWAMYPFYAAFGRSAVGVTVAVAATAWCWAAAALTLAWRRAGDALTAILGLGTVVLVAGLGPAVFTEPWNPWFTVMPMLALTVSTWAVLARCPWALVMVVAAGTYCVQAHLGYAPLVGLLGVISVAGFWWNARRDPDPASGLVPLGVAVGVAALMWLPPVVQQFTGDPGNISVTIDAYRAESGREAALGLAGGLELVLAYLSPLAPARLIDDLRPTERGIDLGSVAVLLAWALAWVAVWRGRAGARMRDAGILLGVVTVALGGAVVAASQIPGDVFGYLVLWLAVLAVMLSVAIAWVAWLVLRPTKVATALPAFGIALVVAFSAAAMVKFAGTEVPVADLSPVAAELVEGVAGELPGDAGEEGSYLVRWDDPLAFGALGTGLLSELERRGFDVGVDDYLRVEMRPHRVLAAQDATSALWVVTGRGIEDWEQLAALDESVVELVRVDPRDEAELERSEALRSEVRAELAEVGGAALADQLDVNYWVARSDPRVGQELQDRIDELSNLGLPTAVFLAPVDQTQP